MVSSKCGRLLAAAGLPAAALGLTLVAGGSASAVPVAHPVKITDGVPCNGHAAVQSMPMHPTQYLRPVPVVDPLRPVVTTSLTTAQTLPEHAIPSHPIAEHAVPAKPAPAHLVAAHLVPTSPAPEYAVPARPQPARPMPEHGVPAPHAILHPAPQHGMVDPLEKEKHEGVVIHVFHQTVTVKIETTSFCIVANQSFERSN